MKHLTAVGMLLVLTSTDAFAQGTNIHSRLGETQSHFNLPAETAVFNYEATISDTSAAYLVKLEVQHNGVEKFRILTPGGEPGIPFFYSCPVNVGFWGLKAGDTLTFILKVIDAATGETVATHVLYGDVGGP